MPILFPFAGRTWVEGQVHHYAWDSKNYPMPIHGFAHAQQWDVQKKHETAVHARLDFREEPGANFHFPWQGHLDLEYEVEPTAFRAQLAVTNQSPEPLPCAPGWHPYFASQGPLDIDLNHTQSYSVNSEGRGLPNKDPVALAALQPNGIVGGLIADEGRVSVLVSSQSQKYELSWRHDDFRYVVFWQGPDGQCIEPWYGLPDPVTQQTYRLVDPGTTWTLGLEIRTLPPRGDVE